MTLLKIADHLHVSLDELTGSPSLGDGPPSLRTILEVVPYGIQVNDLEGSIVYSNPAHQRLHGYAPEELLGKKKIWDLLRVEDRPALQRYFEDLKKTQPPPTPFLGLSLRKDGTVVPVRVDWRYLRNRNNEPRGFISGILPAGDPEARGPASHFLSRLSP